MIWQQKGGEAVSKAFAFSHPWCTRTSGAYCKMVVYWLVFQAYFLDGQIYWVFRDDSFVPDCGKSNRSSYMYVVGDIVDGVPKALFSIATTPRCREGRYSFPRISSLLPLIMLSVKQGSTKYHFKSLWYDSTWDWTQDSRAIGEHSNHYARPRLNLRSRKVVNS